MGKLCTSSVPPYLSDNRRTTAVTLGSTSHVSRVWLRHQGGGIIERGIGVGVVFFTSRAFAQHWDATVHAWGQWQSCGWSTDPVPLYYIFHENPEQSHNHNTYNIGTARLCASLFSTTVQAFARGALLIIRAPDPSPPGMHNRRQLLLGLWTS